LKFSPTKSINKLNEGLTFMTKVTILGAGSGGYTYAADLTLLGHTITMFEFPYLKNNVDPILETGGIEILQGMEELSDLSGQLGPERTGFAKIHKVSFDIKKAIEDAEVIINPVPANYHKAFADACAPYLKDGQIVITFGKGGGALTYNQSIKDLGKKTKVILGESNTLGYGCTLMGRIKGKEYANKVRIEGVSHFTTLAAFPGKNTPKVIDTMISLYPKGTRSYNAGFNVIETILLDYNAITHVPPMICNAGRIETGDKTYCLFGKDSSTPSVVRIMQKVDEERMAIGKAVGMKVISFEEDRKRAKTFYDTIHTPYLEICEGPFSLNSRYLTEDIPYGLVTFASLGDMLNVPTPVVDAEITLASVLNNTDYWKEGRTVEKLGLNPSWKVNQLNKYLAEGEF
jgi:opine dehydrogenase